VGSSCPEEGKSRGGVNGKVKSVMSGVGINEGTGRTTRVRTYVSGMRMGEWRYDTVTICKCAVYALKFE
jgi:hypothetical protein